MVYGPVLLTTILFNMKRFLIVGCGGVGVIAAYTLELCPEIEVTAVVRSDFDVVVERGYQIESVDYGTIGCYRPKNMVRSVDEAAESGTYDYVIVSTKNIPDITRVEDLIEGVVTPETVIVLLQNGIHIDQPVIAKFPRTVVLSGISMISSTIYNAKIAHEGHDSLTVGYFRNGNISKDVQEQAARKFVKYYHNDKNECKYDADVSFTRWRKLVYNVTLNPICALTDVDVGRVELFGGNDALVKTAMKELYAVAASDNVILPPEVMDFMLHSDDGVYYAPSMLVHIRKGNYVEVEVILGNVVRLAQKNGVAVPMLTVMYHLLLIVQKRTMEKKGWIQVPRQRLSGVVLDV